MPFFAALLAAGILLFTAAAWEKHRPGGSYALSIACLLLSACSCLSLIIRLVPLVT